LENGGEALDGPIVADEKKNDVVWGEPQILASRGAADLGGFARKKTWVSTALGIISTSVRWKKFGDVRFGARRDGGERYR